MADKKQSLYIGTPLNKYCDDRNPASSAHEGPITSRRIRLNQQQYARDEQGRRRFHGAFTGGFSAGYYNSTDTPQGFRPKSFVSHRRDKQDGRNSDDILLVQKPEDFMDEEDLGEFGIAPRKIRLVGDNDQYRSCGPRAGEGIASRLQSFLTPTKESIGEEIFRRMTGCKRVRDVSLTREDPLSKKNDLHGLGYKPLSVPFSSSDARQRNPVNAVLKGGKVLQISGEAFGCGVLDDDEDHVENTDEYGYDSIMAYNFESKSRLATRTKETVETREAYFDAGVIQIPGFSFARETKLTESCDDDILKKYPMPKLEANWRAPTRSEPYVPPKSNQNAADRNLIWQKTQQSTSSFASKFTPGTSKLVSLGSTEQKSGLLSYSDLKANEELESKSIQAAKVIDHPDLAKASISRTVFEWRPCSLLCKHFNVPNPFPDNSFFGLRPSSLERETPEGRSGCRITNKGSEFLEEPADIEYLRSIFDVVVIDDNASDNECHDSGTIGKSDGESDAASEDEPQIVEANELAREFKEGDTKLDNDSDIVVVSVPKPKPEVIVLSSSSLSSSPSLSTCSRSSAMSAGESSGGHDRFGLQPTISADNDLDEDSYGPPLPPTRQTLLGVDHQGSVSRHRSSSLLESNRSSKRKRKKEKRQKRRSKRSAKGKQVPFDVCVVLPDGQNDGITRARLRRFAEQVGPLEEFREIVKDIISRKL